jgi:nitroreductase
MELVEVLRTTGAIRDFTDEPVPDEVVFRILDTARFGPSGGNVQGWRVVVVKDRATRRTLRNLYQDGWYDYLALAMAGLRPWSPVNDRDAERQALDGAAAIREQAESGPGGFAEHLDEVPVLLALYADLAALAAIDRDADRYSFVGGASIYPFAWSILLAAREEGLGGVITTVAVRNEAEVDELLDAPESYALAAIMALGQPVRQPTRLTRAPVESFTTVDSVGGEPFGP